MLDDIIRWLSLRTLRQRGTIGLWRCLLWDVVRRPLHQGLFGRSERQRTNDVKRFYPASGILYFDGASLLEVLSAFSMWSSLSNEGLRRGLGAYLEPTGSPWITARSAVRLSCVRDYSAEVSASERMT